MLKAISRIVDFIVWLVSFLLVARFVMQFFGARTTAPFVGWLYRTTGDFMEPFTGIFPNIVLDSGHLIDLAAIIAAIVYAIVGYAVSAFLDSVSDHLAYKGKRPEEQVMHSPNPVAPSVLQKPINEPVNPKS